MRARTSILFVIALSSVACKRSGACDATDAVSLELCGPRREWVGQWLGERARHRTYIDIGPHGGYRLGESGRGPILEGDIVGFAGNDIKLRSTDGGEEIVIAVTESPHAVGDHWEMVVSGLRYTR